MCYVLCVMYAAMKQSKALVWGLLEYKGLHVYLMSYWYRIQLGSDF